MAMENLMTAQEVADKLGVSVYTVHRLRARPDGIPAYRVGRSIRFRPEEVDAYLAAQAIQPIQEQRPLANMRRFKYVPGMKVV